MIHWQMMIGYNRACTNGDLHVFLPSASGSGTSTYSFSEITRVEKHEYHPFVHALAISNFTHARK